MMSVINSIGDVCFTLFYILLVLMAVVVLYDYFRERKACKSEANQSESEVQLEGSLDCSDSEDELTGYADCMCEISSINVEIFIASRHLRELNDPELKFTLEELKIASDHICNSLRHIYKLNYPVDEEELNK